MSVAVKQVSPVEVRQELLDLLQTNLGTSPEARFEWFYTLNPAGPAWCWFAYEGNQSTAVGMTSLFPRHMYVDGKKMTCGQVSHFVIDSGYRSLGPALLLQRATFEPVNSGALAFCYDCPPHERGMSTFVRLGMHSSCDVTRYAFLFRSDEYWSRKLGKAAWTKPVVATTNMLFTMRRSARHMAGLEICEHAGAFGDEFSCLDRIVSSSGRVRASRSAEDLTWLYRNNCRTAKCETNGNHGEYRILTARRGGELVAFVVVSQRRAATIASIVDLFGSRISDVGPPLLDAAINVCRQYNVHALHGFCSEDSELCWLLRSRGFRPRERVARVVAYEHPPTQAGRLLHPGLRWPFGQVEVML